MQAWWITFICPFSTESAESAHQKLLIYLYTCQIHSLFFSGHSVYDICLLYTQCCSDCQLCMFCSQYRKHCYFHHTVHSMNYRTTWTLVNSINSLTTIMLATKTTCAQCNYSEREREGLFSTIQQNICRTKWQQQNKVEGCRKGTRPIIAGHPLQKI